MTTESTVIRVFAGAHFLVHKGDVDGFPKDTLTSDGNRHAFRTGKVLREQHGVTKIVFAGISPMGRCRRSLDRVVDGIGCNVPSSLQHTHLAGFKGDSEFGKARREELQEAAKASGDTVESVFLQMERYRADRVRRGRNAAQVVAQQVVRGPGDYLVSTHLGPTLEVLAAALLGDYYGDSLSSYKRGETLMLTSADGGASWDLDNLGFLGGDHVGPEV